MRDDPALFRKFSDSLPSTPALDIVRCPRCMLVREVATSFNGLSKWAFKQEDWPYTRDDGKLGVRPQWISHSIAACRPTCEAAFDASPAHLRNR